MITQEELKRALTYNPESGEFTWLTAKNRSVKLGDRAGCVDTLRGYRRLGFNGKLWLEHRLAFLYMTGTIPVEIDHINGDSSDNRWSNLREVIGSGNQQNKAKRVDNTSGIKGVCWDASRGSYKARCQTEHKTKTKRFHPKDFGSKEYALKAAADWVVAERAVSHGEFARHE